MSLVLRNMFVTCLRKVMLPRYVPQFNVHGVGEIAERIHSRNELNLPVPELDIEFLCHPDNKHILQKNIINRKGVGDINRVHELYYRLNNENLDDNEKNNVLKELQEQALMIPNMSYPPLLDYGENPKVIKVMDDKKCFNFKPKEFSEITKELNLLRSENLANFTGQRSYYLLGDLAEMERALINYSILYLLKRDFSFTSVPNILNRKIVESCGMNTRGPRTQVYELEPRFYGPDICLSGTSEMALAGLHMNQVYDAKELPLKLVAVSRCYRAETSSVSDERGIYRVHEFNKVEMFGITTQEHSSEMLEEFRNLQEETFSSLGLHTQTLDMPLHELGAPAYRKYDIEAWLPGREMFGEISSCSNCTDYQSRRLNIKYSSSDVKQKKLLHAHTVNGTACAIPRMLIALLETYQQADGTVTIPSVLQPYMRGKTTIKKQTKVPKMEFIRSKFQEQKYSGTKQ